VVFNAEKTLPATLASVCQQDYPYLEYIVIDGASTDQTLAILSQYDAHLSHWRSEPDLGLYDAMNKGIALSHGALIALLNAGDYFEPGALATLARHWPLVQSGGILTANCRLLLNHSPHSVEESGAPQRLPLKMIPHASVFVSRSIYEQWGLFDLNFKITSDFEFLNRCWYQQVPFHFIKQVLTTVSPRGVSGNYYQTELDCLRVRLRYKSSSWPKIIGLSALSWLTITVHLLLDWGGIWSWLQEKKYARSR
jgi:glycosyltransferase involved in cell wall biosynthesis